MTYWNPSPGHSSISSQSFAKGWALVVRKMNIKKHRYFILKKIEFEEVFIFDFCSIWFYIIWSWSDSWNPILRRLTEFLNVLARQSGLSEIMLPIGALHDSIYRTRSIKQGMANRQLACEKSRDRIEKLLKMSK